MTEPNFSAGGDRVSPDSLDSPLVIIDGPWDTTVRPRPPYIPHDNPFGVPPAQRPQPP